MAKHADSPGVKSARTKGPIELRRAAQAAAWTKKHGKDDAKTPIRNGTIHSAIRSSCPSDFRDRAPASALIRWMAASR